jgi:hypothetical protein
VGAKKLLCARYFEIEERHVGRKDPATDDERKRAALELLDELFPDSEHTAQEVAEILKEVDEEAFDVLSNHLNGRVRAKSVH